MLIRRGSDLPAREITDEKTYIARSEFIRRAAGAVLGVAAAPLLTVCADDAVADAGSAAAQTPLENVKPKVVTSDEPLNTFEQITTYNNFYEFGTGKNDPAR